MLAVFAMAFSVLGLILTARNTTRFCVARIREDETSPRAPHGQSVRAGHQKTGTHHLCLLQSSQEILPRAILTYCHPT